MELMLNRNGSGGLSRLAMRFILDEVGHQGNRVPAAPLHLKCALPIRNDASASIHITQCSC